MGCVGIHGFVSGAGVPIVLLVVTLLNGPYAWGVAAGSNLILTSPYKGGGGGGGNTKMH